MGKFDKDRPLKELAIRFCLARGLAPFLEVDVPSFSDLSDSQEVLTDIDVLGVDVSPNGEVTRTVFDCKSGKMSAINRAFWASGVLRYTGCDDAFILLKSRAVSNHRLTALQVGVDLHDEQSFIDLGEAYEVGFNSDSGYISSIDRWNEVYDSYVNVGWGGSVYEQARMLAPLSQQPWSTFRGIVAALRHVRGDIDPAKDKHIAIFADVLAGSLLLWSAIGRDVRRFYLPGMPKQEFEKVLRYYIWGGRESYSIRQDLMPRTQEGAARILELPAWENFVKFAGLVISAPQELFGCVNICRSFAIRCASGPSPIHDAELSKALNRNKRARQFIFGLSDYMVLACGLPRDLGLILQKKLSELPIS